MNSVLGLLAFFFFFLYLCPSLFLSHVEQSFYLMYFAIWKDSWISLLLFWVLPLYGLISKLLWLLQDSVDGFCHQVFLKLIFKVRMLSILYGELFPWLIVIRACYSNICFKKFCLLQITRNTTPMYRTPEMVDLYSNFPIGEKQDIWVRNFSLGVS